MAGQTSSGVPVPPLRGNEVIDLVSGGRNQATTQEIADLASGGGTGTVTSITTTGPGISGGPISTTGALAVQWNAGAVSALGMGLGLSAGTLVANGLPAVFPESYGTITDGGSFGDALAHPASANGFATLGALQAVYSFATATSNDMAGLMIQAAVNAADAAGLGTPVWLQAGKFRLLPTGVTLPSATKTILVGSGQGTILLCANCGTHAAVTITLIANGPAPIANLQLFGLGTDRVSPSGSTGGTAAPASPTSGFIYVTDSVGILISQCVNMRMYGVNIFNFDKGIDWDYVNGDVFCDTFYDAVYQFNNKAINVTSLPPNSFEAMNWINSNISNNNYGAYLICSDNPTPGASAVGGGEFYFTACKFDYNIVQFVYTVGGTASGDILGLVQFNCCHFETSSAVSGTAATRGFNDNMMTFIGGEAYEAGSPAIGFISGSFFSWTTFSSFKGPGDNLSDGAASMPLAYSNSVFLQVAFDGTNTNRIAPRTVLLRTANGDISGYMAADPNYYNTIGANTTLSMTLINGHMNVTATCTLTVPNSSDSNFMTGTQKIITAYPGATVTLAAAGGVTINSTGVGLTFGGVKGATIFLNKTATNVWLASGQMT